MLHKVKYSKPEDEFNDLGLGTKFSEQKQRLIDRNGEFNVQKKGMPFSTSFSIYHELISMSWWKFNLLVLISYVTINLAFAFLYLTIGVEQLEGIRSISSYDKFWDAFFFSGQTLTTVGFGRISPLGFQASSLAAVESMLGLLGFALATGLLYGRFSRPNAKLIYSHNALISPYRDINGFMFRIINARRNQLIEMDVQVVFSRLEIADGKAMRRYYPLDLERSRVNFFPLSWTIVHPITRESPLYNCSADELRESDAEVLIMIKAFDDAFSQTVHSRSSYMFNEIICGAKFDNVFTNKPGEKTVFDMTKFHRYHKVELKGDL